ncbi:MAG: GTP-binding protein [Promethearchaeota archaeon]
MEALFKWYMQEAGSSLISVLIVNKEGLVVESATRDSVDKFEEKKFIAAFSSLVDIVLRKLTKEFDLGTFGAGTFDTDKYRFIFCEAGTDFVLVSIFDALTMVDSMFPFTYIVADKVARIIDGTLPVSPVIPKISRKKDIFDLKQKMIELNKRMAQPYNYIYKLSLIGDGGVGKTSMVQRYVNGFFSENYKATIGTFITKKECYFEEINARVRLMIWDLAGQPQFKRIWPDYLTDSNAGIIVFDITNRKSFENVKKWYNEIIKVASPGLILVLAGNKIDLNENRVISKEEGEELAEQLGIPYIETSAKTNEKISDIFEKIALKLINVKVNKKDFLTDYYLMNIKSFEDSNFFLISEIQLQLLFEFFKKQLDCAIEKKEAIEYSKFLNILKEIKRNPILS